MHRNYFQTGSPNVSPHHQQRGTPSLPSFFQRAHASSPHRKRLKAENCTSSLIFPFARPEQQSQRRRNIPACGPGCRGPSDLQPAFPALLLAEDGHGVPGVEGLERKQKIQRRQEWRPSGEEKATGTKEKTRASLLRGWTGLITSPKPHEEMAQITGLGNSFTLLTGRQNH